MASWLGVTLDQLEAMASQRRANPGCPLDSGIGQHDLAERYGADRLAAVLAG